MSIVYVDTSVLAEIMLDGAGAAAVAELLLRFQQSYSSPLLEAELRSTAARERVHFPDESLRNMFWVRPDRSLSSEMKQVLSAGYLRGADLWHLSCALYLFQKPAGNVFLTLDTRQKEVAEKLGFSLS